MKQSGRVILVAMSLIILVTLASADERVSMFGSQLIHKKLNPEIWKKDTEQRQENRGMVLYKHKGIRDNQGNNIQPVIGIVYERIPDNISSVEQYAAIARERTKFPVEAVVRRDDIKSIIYFCRYDSGMVHNLVIAHFVFKRNGIQITGDATQSVYGKVEDEIQQFIQSIKFSDGIGKNASAKTFPFTAEEDTDGARFVWFMYQQSGLPYDYLPAKQFPNSKHFRPSPNNIPQVGDVAWWKEFMAIYGGKDAPETSNLMTAPGAVGLRELQKKYGPVKWFRYWKKEK
jgi:hypothetical protein